MKPILQLALDFVDLQRALKNAKEGVAGGADWLEAGTPTNGWFVDVGQNPIVTLVLPESSERYRAVVAEGDAAHAHLRALLREKYGFRDWWVGSLLVDSADSIAVRLDPIRP